jgi:hypothetical protein
MINSNCKSFKHVFKCFLVCFAMVQVMLSFWSLFIEFLGWYSRCKVTNGVMPRVLGPTNFYLKLWVNILTIRILLCSSGWTSECFCVLHQNVDVHQTFIWVLSYAFHMIFWAISISINFSMYNRMLLNKDGLSCSRSALDCVQERN